MELRFDNDGVEITQSAVDDEDLGLVARFIDDAVASNAGARSFLLNKTVSQLIAENGTLQTLACRLMGRAMRAVRVICFDKTAESNWAVPWHQDRTIAVRQRVDAEGFGPWSVKKGVPHVEPPADLLANMLALRLHIDNCPASNGALEVLPGSWKWGRLPAPIVAERAASAISYVCAVGVGDIVAMRGLTIHSSKASRNVSRRRVLHVDFADRDLPRGLQWAMEM